MSTSPQGRRRALLAAGVIDSAGLAVGWTAMSLHVVHDRGLPALGLLAAAMLIGVAASAPLTGWLAARVDGRRLLQTTAVGEAALRAVAFLALFNGAPLGAVAGLVLASSALAWTGFAGMRAEMALIGGGERWLAAYTAGIAAAEALGALLAASLPTGAGGALRPTVVAVLAVVYAASLIPTFFVARGARGERAPSGSIRRQLAGRWSLLAGGGAVTLLATGPTLLAVGIAAALHGRGAVGPAMLLFAIGSLTGPALAGWISRLVLPTGVVWCFLGILMLAGWGLAPVALAGLLVAQLISGIAMGAFEGIMDAEVSRRGDVACVTGGLAWAGATRALGSAASVSVVPLAMGAFGVGRTAAVGTIGLVAGAVVIAFAGAGGGALAAWRRRRAPQVEAVPGWVLVLTTDDEELDTVAERFHGVEVFGIDDAGQMLILSWGPDRPDMVVLGMQASAEDVAAVEELVGEGGPWAGTFVRVLAREGRRGLHLVDAA